MKGHKGCSSVSLLRMNLARPVWDWDWSLKGVKDSVHGKLTFPPEETGIVSPMPAVCSVISLLPLTLSHFSPGNTILGVIYLNTFA